MSQFTDSVFSDNNPNRNYNNFYGYNQTAQNIQPNRNIQNGLIWFVCILPVFGLFLENYAINAIVGIILWSAVVVLIPFCCVIDCKNLEAQGYDMRSAKKFLFFPPLYIHKRNQIFHHSFINVLIISLGLATAVFFNGFSQGLTLTANKVQAVVQNSYVSNLENFSGTSTNIIGTQLEEYFGKSAEWTSEKTNDGFSVVCSGTKGGETIKVYINVKHDGFCYQGVKVDKITVNNVKANKETSKKLLTEIFIPETEKDSEKTDNSTGKTQKA